MSQEQSALIVTVPEADQIVARFREQLDSGAALGVPAHVTILYPFMPAEMITDDVVDELSRLFLTISSFDVRFESIGWFGQQVVFARPASEEPFHRLTSLVAQRWPAWPPYEGAHADPIPHLTIGDNGDPNALTAAAEAVTSALPIVSRVSEIQLFKGTLEPRTWSRQMGFALG